MNFLNLIRYKNLIIIVLMQVFVKYGFFNALDVQAAMNDFQFTLLIFATLCIAAAGNIINDIYDIEIDTINKPEKVIVSKAVSEKKATTLFIVLSVLGVASGFYLANSIGKPGFAVVFIIISALLYVYASYLKGILVVGNLLISMLVAFSILIVPIFDIIPAIDTDNMDLQVKVLKIILHYTFFAFIINLIREIVKDIQDVDGDKNGGLQTLPITIGRKRATYTVFGLGVAAVLTVIGYMYVYLYSTQSIMLYFLFLIVAPLLYFCIKSWNAETKKEFTFLSLFLKIIMFTGMCSILLYPNVILK